MLSAHPEQDKMDALWNAVVMTHFYDKLSKMKVGQDL